MCGQTSKLAVSADTSEYMADLLKYKDRALLTHVQWLLPKFMLSTPRMLAYRRRIEQVYDLIGSSHTPAQRKDKPRDLIDDLISLHASDPQFFPETDTKFAFVMSLITAIYTGNALAFALFELFSRPDVCLRVKAEAAALFGDGDPQQEDFTKEAIDVTHRLLLETLRLYPGVPLQLRNAMNTFVVQGFEIPAGARVLVASTSRSLSGRELRRAALVRHRPLPACTRREQEATAPTRPSGLVRTLAWARGGWNTRWR